MPVFQTTRVQTVVRTRKRTEVKGYRVPRHSGEVGRQRRGRGDCLGSFYSDDLSHFIRFRCGTNLGVKDAQGSCVCV